MRKRKIYPIFFIVICLLFAAFTPVTAHAATKLNHSQITLCRYHSCTLKLSGTSKKITWQSADKTVATVSKKGKVTAVSAGKTTITAKAGTKKYTCKVTVKDYDNETILAAYGYQALQQVVPDASTISVKNVWLGSTPANVPFGMLECNFKDKSGKNIHAYVYTYEQEVASTSYINAATSFYENSLVLKFDNREMDAIQQTRVTRGSVSKVKAANKYIFAYEKISVEKGKNFDTLYTWLKL